MNIFIVNHLMVPLQRMQSFCSLEWRYSWIEIQTVNQTVLATQTEHWTELARLTVQCWMGAGTRRANWMGLGTQREQCWMGPAQDNHCYACLLVVWWDEGEVRPMAYHIVQVTRQTANQMVLATQTEHRAELARSTVQCWMGAGTRRVNWMGLGTWREQCWTGPGTRRANQMGLVR